MSEFSWIAHYFAPLSGGFPGARNLTDDAAFLTPPPGETLVISTDTIGEGVHFTGDESPDLIARKLLRVNMSDLAAKGAKPLIYFLNISLPSSINESWIKRFCSGLEADQAEFGIHLAGGDTTETYGKLTLTVTAIGHTPSTSPLTRAGACIGDDLYVSGTLGDAALALQFMKQYEPVPDYLLHRYQLPQPRTILGQALRGIASACIDVSDGLLQDAGHLCTASACGADIFAAQLPLSPAAREVLKLRPYWQETVSSGGDDYELLFTASADKADEISSLSTRLSVPVTRIGRMVGGDQVALRDANGLKLPVTQLGYRHF